MSGLWSWLHRMRLPRAEVLAYCDPTSSGEPIMSLAGLSTRGRIKYPA